MSNDIKTIEAKYHFNEQEQRKLGQDLASTNMEVDRLEKEFDKIKTDYKNRVKSQLHKANQLTNKLYLGFEMRPYECRVEYDYENGIITYREVRTERVILEQPFAAEDYKRKMPI